jgi:hypothetical protein
LRDRADTLNIRNRQLSQETQFAKFDLIKTASILRPHPAWRPSIMSRTSCSTCRERTRSRASWSANSMISATSRSTFLAVSGAHRFILAFFGDCRHNDPIVLINISSVNAPSLGVPATEKDTIRPPRRAAPRRKLRRIGNGRSLLASVQGEYNLRHILKDRSKA